MNTPSTVADTVPPRQNYYPALLKALAYIYCLNMFAFFDADPDLWGHLKFGQLIWQTGSIPFVDPYSYTAKGLPWINHEWLTEVSFYLIYSAFGSTGLLILKLLIGLFIVHALSSLYFSRETNLIAYAICFFLLAHVLSPGFTTRPHLTTWLFLTWFIYVMQNFFDGNQKALVWTPLIMLLWVNCHGGVIAGIGIFGVVTACELIRCFFKGGNQGKLLLKYFTASWLALLINPYSYKLLIFYIETIPAKRQITEWNAIPLFNSQYIYFKIMVLLFCFTLFISQSKRLWELAANLVAIYFSFRHQRHTVLAGILMASYLPAQLAAIKLSDTLRYRPSPLIHKIFQASLVILLLIQTYSCVSLYQSARFKIQVNPRTYPVYAVRFMKLNNINGNILNPFDWGEYLIWHLPNSKVSIDGRRETVYPNKLIIESLDFDSTGTAWQRVPDLYPATDIILKSRTNQNTEKLPGWVEIYEDPISLIFIRETNSAMLARFNNKELIDPKEIPSWDFP